MQGISQSGLMIDDHYVPWKIIALAAKNFCHLFVGGCLYVCWRLIENLLMFYYQIFIFEYNFSKTGVL